jgi:thioredoxin reductase (NADPH)
MKAQLRALFEKMQGSAVLKLYLDKREISRELESYMNELALISSKLTVSIADSNASSDIAPCVRVCYADGKESGLAFHGVPGGHEFSSFVLGIYNAIGEGQRIDGKIEQRIKAISKPCDIAVLVSLSCTMCPDTVVAAQHIAAKNSNVTAEIYDIHRFEEIRKRYNVMSVPCIVVNGEQVSFGKKNIEQILELIE